MFYQKPHNQLISWLWGFNFNQTILNTEANSKLQTNEFVIYLVNFKQFPG